MADSWKNGAGHAFIDIYIRRFYDKIRAYTIKNRVLRDF